MIKSVIESELAVIPKGCKLAIVGSADLTFVERMIAAEIVYATIETVRPSLVVSGKAPGVDTIAEVAANLRRIPFSGHPPKVQRWEDGFKPRNMKIAHECEALVRIVSPNTKTYGSGWTRDYARSLGKPTVEFVL